MPTPFRAAWSFTLVTLTLVAPAFADRAAVEQSMRAMEAAVLAGDPEAYLRHVATDDPIFLKEQQNWAKDLKLHVPTSFVLRIVEAAAEEPGREEAAGESEPGIAAPRFDDDTGVARFEMSMEWTMPMPGDRPALNRTVSFPVRFERVRRIDGSQSSEVWLYKGEDWQSLHSHSKTSEPSSPASSTTPATDPTSSGSSTPPPPREPHIGDGATPAILPTSDAPNRCRFFPGFESVASDIIEVLPEVRAHVDAAFDNPIEHVQEVKVYASMRHLQASIYLSYVDGLSGWNEPGESIKLLASRRTSKSGLRALLGHEYGHVATFEYGEKITVAPWWVLEGVAEVSADEYMADRAAALAKADAPDAQPDRRRSRDVRTLVENWAKTDKLARWEDISDFRKTPGSLGRHVYKQGQHMVMYISEQFGRPKRNQWLRALAAGESIDEATRGTLGVGFDDLDARWRESLPKPEPEGKAEGDKAEPAVTPAP